MDTKEFIRDNEELSGVLFILLGLLSNTSQNVVRIGLALVPVILCDFYIFIKGDPVKT